MHAPQRLRPTLLTLAISSALAAPAAHAATITVTSLTDDGTGCTLREAIASANTDTAVGGCAAGAGADVIVFDGALSLPGVITLSGGELVVTQALSINGPGAASLAVDGDGASRVLRITGTTAVSISGLTLRNGGSVNQGAGIDVGNGRLTLVDSVVSGNVAEVTNGDARGGGLFVASGSLVLTNSTVSGNTATTTSTNPNPNTGYPYYDPVDPYHTARGGGIFVEGGSVTLTDSEVSGNLATLNSTASSYDIDSDAEGGGIYVASGTLNVSGSTISGNTASFSGGSGAWFSGSDARGGGVFVESGTASLVDSVVSGNAVSVASMANESGGDAEGGGLYVNSGTLTLSNTTVSGNTASNTDTGTFINGDARGSGIYLNSGAATLTNVVVSDNVARVAAQAVYADGEAEGGGIWVDDGRMSIVDSVISGNLTENTSTGSNPYFSNTDARGGGIYLDNGTMTISNSLIENNRAITNATTAANSGEAEGGGIYVDNGTLTLLNSTVAGNTAAVLNAGQDDHANADGGGIFLDNGTLIVVNSTISGNTAINASTANNVYGTARGGGLFVDNGSLSLLNATVFANTVSAAAGAVGGGLYTEGYYFDPYYVYYPSLSLRNTIIGGSTGGGDCQQRYALPVDSTNNLIEGNGSDACGLVDGSNGNLIGSAPQLDALADNGCVSPAGLVGSGSCARTHALQLASPARSAADPAICAAAPVGGIDERGYGRDPALCDIGAFEADPTPSAPSEVEVAPDGTVSWSPPAFFGDPPNSCTAVVQPGGQSCTAIAPATACTISGLDPNTAYTFTVYCSNDNGRGPGAAASSAPAPSPIPTLSWWGLLGSAGLLGLLTAWQRRRIPAARR